MRSRQIRRGEGPPGRQGLRRKLNSAHVEARLLQGTRRTAERDRSRDQEGLSPPGDEVSPGSQSGRSGGRRAIQGSQGGLRGADATRRSAPPTTSTATRASRRSSAAAAGGFSAGDAFSDIFGDVFGDIFGGARRGGRSQVFRGADLRYELELDLDQAVFGHQVEIEVPQACPSARPATAAARPRAPAPVTCDTCDGAGQVRVSQGFFQLQQTCPRCRGAGTIVRNPCDTCLGQGRVRRTKQALR